MATLTVGPGKKYATITAAVTASHSGDTIDVQAGTYTNNFLTISHSLTLQAVGGMVHMVETHAPPNHKGMITVGTVGDAPNVTINGFEISGVAIPAADGDNGAAIRYQSGNLTLNGDWFQHNQEGLLATPLSAGTGSIKISDSEFGFNGSGNGQTHNIYIGKIASFSITGSYVHDTVVGNEIQSRAAANTITGDRIFGNASNDSMQINLPNGGHDIVTNDILEKGLKSENPRFIAFGEAPSNGGGPLWTGSSLLAEGDTFVNDHGAGVAAIWNDSGLAVVTAADDKLWNIPVASAFVGPRDPVGNVELLTRPALNTEHPWVVGAP